MAAAFKQEEREGGSDWERKRGEKGEREGEEKERKRKS